MSAMLASEHQEQAALFRWAWFAQVKHPALALLYAIPNGGHRHKAVAARMKAEGVKAGVPDLCLPVARGGSSDKLKVGEWVLAIGSPFGFELSATAGIVSAKGRALPRENYVPFIQTDVAINPGNSGGPLFNLDGEVVGVNSQIYSRTGGYMGLSFSIPIEVAMDVAQQLKEHGKVSRGWLGVLIQDVTRELAESFGMSKPEGALVAKVLPDSPAEEGKLQVGDVIVSFNGKQILSSSALPPVVGSTPVGKRVPVEVMREGRARTLWVMLGELPDQDKQIAKAEESKTSSDNRLGIQAADLTAEQRKELELDGGVLVERVGEGAAANAGIRDGDPLIVIGSITFGVACVLFLVERPVAGPDDGP